MVDQTAVVESTLVTTMTVVRTPKKKKLKRSVLDARKEVKDQPKNPKENGAGAAWQPHNNAIPTGDAEEAGDSSCSIQLAR
jgi:hypothetical protein